MHRLRTYGLESSQSPPHPHRMQGMIRTAPPRPDRFIGTSLCPTASRQPSTVQIGCPADLSMLNTRLRRCAQVIDARRSAGVGSSESPCARRLPPLPRLAGVTHARY